jgi:hypothetical protein
MSDTLKAALIALMGTVILAPLVARGLTWFSEKRSQLLVVLSWNEAGKCSYLEGVASKNILESKAFREAPSGDENRWKDIRIFRSFFAAQSYMRFLVLKNWFRDTKEKLAGPLSFLQLAVSRGRGRCGSLVLHCRRPKIPEGTHQPTPRRAAASLWHSPLWDCRRPTVSGGSSVPSGRGYSQSSAALTRTMTADARFPYRISSLGDRHWLQRT